ncbi:phospholipase ABHD3 [Procambarus clarkii]|uniref:phospholipase ABHD3 n=1 Tax=Procambarus clarkii TaxID=6728 RepID=UPI001E67836E|nr:phospholipase ABHD3-like [Procambarus clarkii]XP_045619174.1 phospholipase ABHD3-like [Procambarus clarkii]
MDWSNLYSESPRIILSITVGVGCLLYYFIEVVKRPVLACRNSAWRGFLETHLTILQEKYWPTPWCYESRCQTILASVLRSRMPDITYIRELLEMKDGGQICLDWLHGAGEADKPIVIILPGLTGSSQSEYVKSLVLAVQEVGARCAVFNNRGLGGIKLKTARTYCAANSDDLEEAIEHIKAKYPKAPLIASGISLGGMILGNYLVTRGEQAAQHLVAAMLLSVPWNVFVGTKSVEKPPWNLLLNRHLAYCLCESVKSMRKQLEGNCNWDLDHVMQSKTIREFDSRFTAVQFGFRDVEEYYRTASLHDKLDNIKVPLMCLSAADDPFQPLEGIPVEEANKSSHVAIVVTARGGHIGFMEGIFPTNKYYSDRIYKQLVRGIFSNLGDMKEVKREAADYVKMMAHSCEGGGS